LRKQEESQTQKNKGHNQIIFKIVKNGLRNAENFRAFGCSAVVGGVYKRVIAASGYLKKSGCSIDISNATIQSWKKFQTTLV